MNKRNWIIQSLKDNNYDKKSVLNLYKKYVSDFNSNVTYESYKRYVYAVSEEVDSSIDSYVLDDKYTSKLEAKNQKVQDLNNIIRKINRESFRIYNNLEELYTQYIDLLSKVDLTKFKIKEHKPSESPKIGILHFSDFHANELIFPEESNNNAYDFDIMSRRLKKLVTESIAIFKFKKITEIHIFMTGDFINSSRRLGEILAQSTSLARATLLTSYLLQQAIIELSQHFSITVSFVVGNESRISEKWDSTNISLSENYDYSIFNFLRMVFKKTPIKFTENSSNGKCVVKMSNGFNALLIHGNQFRTPNGEKEIPKFIQEYVYNGTKINGVFYGHYHSASIGDFISRSSSLCGANAYSSNDLGYLSRASQNLYIINKDLGYDAIKVDLQNTTEEGYDIIDELERYAVKSSRYNNTVTIKNLV